MKDIIYKIVKEFSSRPHGSSGLDSDEIFIQGENELEYCPLTYVIKNNKSVAGLSDLKSHGFVLTSYSFLESHHFENWFFTQFNRKISQKEKLKINLAHLPDQKKIFEAVEIVHQVYEILKTTNVIINGKNLPVQLGEWYAKVIFGLHQVKSASQRGFDFHFQDGKKVEVKVHWHDVTSPKGVKLKKSLLELSDYTIIMYIAKNFMIRDIVFLDSNYILRKFDNKGHTIFLKDQDVASYFFSKSNKHFDKVVNKNALLRFASPGLALKLDAQLSQGS